jgi:hypothetical protein
LSTAPATYEDCASGRARFSPACLACGKRYFTAIDNTSLADQLKTAWKRKVVDDWAKWGHPKGVLFKAAGMMNV